MPDTVVITRPAAQAGPLAARVAALGWPVTLLPLLEIHALDGEEECAQLQAVLARLAEYDLVAFVSPNAIDCVFAHLSAWPSGLPLAVVGEGSRLALGAHGVTDANASITSPLDTARSDSEHLLLALDLPALRGKRVLIVRGDGGRDYLADGLRAAGAEVEFVTAYRRKVPELTPALRATLEKLLQHNNDWIITSSEALRGFLALLGEMGDEKTTVVKMQQQHLIVPHARIAQTAAVLGFARVTLTGSGDAGVLAALQSRP
ncbi:uroporphyrinogen III synthase [Janthinobacterium sp. ROICE36]|uniref:uroporphyrinogen-III synthase n=1 Tax=Janthinobacterium sp. ROICE36 TaxID=2048670 RepID=UPI000C7F023E|nr:uroporphyrinogen-III synthase [Janthinobacterium sp. ROICE36]PLY41341.1 uroporphyrinogen III synthase [Janthinobacterium sp. ROICE36]